MSWPLDVTGRPLKQVMKMVPAGGEGENFRLPECQICGSIIAGTGHNDPECGDTARGMLGWALAELVKTREEAGLPGLPRNTLDVLRAMNPQARRKTMTPRQTRRIMAS